MSTIHPGYMGVANIITSASDYEVIRFSDASLTAKQDVMIPDMVMGHWDRAAYNFGKIEIGGGLSGPVTASFANGASSLWDWGYSRGTCGGLDSREVLLTYYCDAAVGSNHNTRSFTGMMVQSLGFSCAAGDVAQFTMELIGATAPTWSCVASAVTNQTIEKLVTWDNVGLTITTGTGIVVPTDGLLSNFDFSIANNITAQYAIRSGATFYPEALVPGVRTITGSISVYDLKAFDGVIGYNKSEPSSAAWDATSARSTMSFAIGDSPTPIEFSVQFHRIEPKLGVGPIISTVGFTGVGVQPTYTP